MNGFQTDKIEEIIADAAGGRVPPELSGVIYSLGRDAEGGEEYDYAFRQLMRLSSHPSAYVQSIVVLGLSLLAVYHRRLDREIVEPVIRRAWGTAEGPDRARIQNAVDDINDALKWGLVL